VVFLERVTLLILVTVTRDGMQFLCVLIFSDFDVVALQI